MVKRAHLEHEVLHTWVGVADSESRCRPMVQWSRALTVVVEFMVASFDRPNDERVRDFWRRACHSVGSEASGEPSTMSGWLTAFCWWLLTHEKKGLWRISQREPLVVKRKGARAGDKRRRETASVQPSQQRKITLDEE